MLRPTAVQVKPEKDYIINVTFDSGETKRFDVKPYIKGDWFGMLENKLYFNKVRTDGFTVVWPDGQDICPDELYECSHVCKP